MAKDYDRERVYQAEKGISSLDWDSLAELRAVLNQTWNHALGQMGNPPMVRTRRFATISTYRKLTNTVSLSPTDKTMLTLAHELSHAIVHNETKHMYDRENVEGHGARFRETYVIVTHVLVGPDAAIQLGTNFAGIPAAVGS